MLSSIFESGQDVDVNTERLLKKIDGSIAMTFKKTRVNTNKSQDKDEKLFNKIREIKGKKYTESLEELERVRELIVQTDEEHIIKLKEELEKIKPNSGGLNPQQM
jgi:predicted  nucleic acid-binding Zn-ribbon protein